MILIIIFQYDITFLSPTKDQETTTDLQLLFKSVISKTAMSKGTLTFLNTLSTSGQEVD